MTELLEKFTNSDFNTRHIYRYAQKFVKNKLINSDKADILTFRQRQTLIIFTDRLLRMFLDMSCVN